MAVLIAITAALALANCSEPHAKAAGLARGNLTADANVIELAIAVCTPEPTITVDESSETVTVTATYIPLKSDGDCGRIVAISLREPLGERIVVDGSTGEEVEIFPADGAPYN